VAKDFRKIAPNRLAWYAGLDAAATLQLARWQADKMGPFLSTWRNLLGPAMHALGQVERWGALLSEANVRLYDAHLEQRTNDARRELAAWSEVPADLNTKSSKQMQALLYERLKMPVLVRTATKAPSCGSEALEALVARHEDTPGHPAPGKTDAWNLLRSLQKLSAARAMRDSYGLGQLENISPHDGRVHTKYKLVRSYRLSSSEPNLQNLKKEGDDDEVEDDGKWAKGCYVAPEGCAILLLDYSQNELRIACSLSGDEVMAEAFAAGVDFHTATAREIFGRPEVSSLERRVAKSINFAIVFGGNEYTVARQLGITPQKALTYVQAWASRFRRLDAWRRQLVSEARQTGASWARWPAEGWTLRRLLPDVGIQGDNKAAKGMREHAERVAQNNPVQCLANLFGLSALTRVVAWIVDSGLDQGPTPVQLFITVHDEIGLYVPPHLLDQVHREARRIMEGYDLGIVKLKVEAEVGDRDMGHTRKIAAAQ
jgi:DNA polymerase-1